jgi:hypothetical protein
LSGSQRLQRIDRPGLRDLPPVHLGLEFQSTAFEGLLAFREDISHGVEGPTKITYLGWPGCFYPRPENAVPVTLSSVTDAENRRRQPSAEHSGDDHEHRQHDTGDARQLAHEPVDFRRPITSFIWTRGGIQPSRIKRQIKRIASARPGR